MIIIGAFLTIIAGFMALMALTINSIVRAIEESPLYFILTVFMFGVDIIAIFFIKLYYMTLIYPYFLGR